jgi:hypothetical protein
MSSRYCQVGQRYHCFQLCVADDPDRQLPSVVGLCASTGSGPRYLSRRCCRNASLYQGATQTDWARSSQRSPRRPPALATARSPRNCAAAATHSALGPREDADRSWSLAHCTMYHFAKQTLHARSIHANLPRRLPQARRGRPNMNRAVSCDPSSGRRLRPAHAVADAVISPPRGPPNALPSA